MKVLIAIGVPQAQEAGAAGVVLNQARELRKLGHEVECWFLDDVLTPAARGHRFDAFLFSWRVAKRVLRDRERFDVVNLHAPSGCLYGLWRKLMWARGAPPYVMTMHGSEDVYVQTMRREQKKGRAQHFGWKNRAWHRAYHQNLYDAAIRTADYGLIVNRQALACTQLKYNRNGNFSFLPNGAEKSFFVEHEYARSPLRLLYVGSWLDRKGVFYLADSFGHVAKNLPDATLTVAGCLISENEVKGYFPAHARSQINVIPFLNREGMPALYAQHDIFVFPSLVEGMPLTLLEAMATGMPIVTTNAGGMVDLIEDGVNGLLVAPGNAGDFARAVERLSGRVELRRELGQEAQRKARRYTWDKMAGQLEQVLLEAARRG